MHHSAMQAMGQSQANRKAQLLENLDQERCRMLVQLMTKYTLCHVCQRAGDLEGRENVTLYCHQPPTEMVSGTTHLIAVLHHQLQHEARDVLLPARARTRLFTFLLLLLLVLLARLLLLQG
jgi:hypothetical protein